MSKKKTAKVENAHVHEDGVLTPARIAAFANDSWWTQEHTLATLRSRLAQSYFEMAATYAAVLIAVMALTASILPIIGETILPFVDRDAVPEWALPAMGAYLLCFPFALVLGLIVAWRVFSKHKTTSVVLLGAYEAELARRYADTSRAGKRWRAERPIVWK